MLWDLFVHIQVKQSYWISNEMQISKCQQSRSGETASSFSIKYLLFGTTSLSKVTAFAGVVSLYTSTFTVKWPVITWTVMCHQFSVKQNVCMAEVSKIYRTNI